MPSNQLTDAASPYLLQHKDNPVHWMEWGEAALTRARQEGKPILLSVGYAACHWCHVMAQESFEDAATAEVMNILFVNIKVDREERPDVDHLYMSALQSLGERGGWPLTMFLTPEAEPFWGGTYFPKVAQFGRPSFVSVLRSVAAAYARQPDMIRGNTRAIMAKVADQRPETAQATLDEALLDEAAATAAGAMDPIDGGLAGPPKFPNAPLLELLLRGGARMRRPDVAEHALHTLRRIAQGGVYDHLGGGFARYSTDARWLVPHFEKMLYDNAQLIDLLALAYAATGEELFKTRIAETVGWLRREMLVGGAFAASLDADSEHVEGKFYVWTQREIEQVLGADAVLFCRAYDVTPGGNWRDEHTGASVTILNRLDTPALTKAEEAKLAALKAALLRVRDDRIRPALDDKILTDWNGFAITALAHAACLCAEPEWLALARSVYAAITAPSASLIHARRGERGTAKAFASDYAAMAGAALALAEATAAETDVARTYVAQARTWLDWLDAHYAAPDGILFMTTDRDQDLPIRLAPLADEATPNANGVYAAALLRMAGMTGEDEFRTRADRLFQAAAATLLRAPLGHCSLLNALDLRLAGIELVLAGEEIGPLMDVAQRLPWPDRVLTTASLTSDAALADSRSRVAGSGAAFVCRGQSCSAPVQDPAALLALFEAPHRRDGAVR